MKINLAKESQMITDTSSGDDVPEQPVIVENYDGGISIVGWDGHSVYMSDRMVKEVCQTMIEYSKTKPKK